MNHHYSDIRKRIASPPLWFDENAVPRYCAFTPDETANIYAEECALLVVACQNCGREFVVCVSSSSAECARTLMLRGQKFTEDAVAALSLASMIRAKLVHYGDPPNVECCPSGPTMNSTTIRVLEYWHRAGASDWTRDPTLEVAMPRKDGE